MIWLRRWFFLLAAIVSVTLWLAALQAEVQRKVDRDAFERVSRDVVEMKVRLEDMDLRARQFYCKDGPTWCR